MSFALMACSLIFVDARDGEWVPLDAIARHVAQPPERVQAALQQLVDDNQVQYATRDGQHFYGIHCEGRQP